MAGVDGDPDDRTLALLLRETTNHLDASIRALRDLDGRIEGLARFNAILVGLVVAGLSFWTRIGPTVSDVPLQVLALLTTGFVAAVVSAALSAWAYLARRVAVGLHPHQLEAIIDLEVQPGELTQELVSGYVKAIAYNFLVLDQSTFRFRLAVVSWIVAIATLSMGALGLFGMTTT